MKEKYHKFICIGAEALLSDKLKLRTRDMKMGEKKICAGRNINNKKRGRKVTKKITITHTEKFN